MTVRCPYCKNLIGVRMGVLVDHYVRLAAKCIGSGEDAALAGQLNQEHAQVRERTARITGRGGQG